MYLQELPFVLRNRPSLTPEDVQALLPLTKRLLWYLADKGVLDQVLRGREDPQWCLISAQNIRAFITQEGYVASGGPLQAPLDTIRKASVSFVRAAGPHAQHYMNEPQTFMAYLESYQEAVGKEIAWLAYCFKLDVPDSLRAILPAAGLTLGDQPPG
jgi:hypothetical protein